VANDEFKFKEFNADSKQCRKTTLAPTFGGPPNKLLALPFNGTVGHYAYSTAERIVGLGCLPLTGDPTKVMGLVAHPSHISSICVSHDGRFLFTAGGHDLTASMFAIDYSVFASSGGSGSLAAFLDLLEGGSGGELHNDIIDYFYLCQLRTQGETVMEDRAISGRIPVEEIASLVRAIGFYPTEEEIENMVNEVRYKHFMSTGIPQDDLSLEEAIQLYVNHRPVSSLNSNEIEAAMEIIAHKYLPSLPAPL
jgi:cilia- and flagella-associated protein 251